MRIKFDEKTLIILATAPAGLGHIRVMQALIQGLSDKTRSEVVGINDPAMQWIHRFSSRNMLFKQIMELTQENRLIERGFSGVYRKWLREHTDGSVKALLEVVGSAVPRPKTVLVLATHFGLAHELAAVKQALSQKLGLKIVLGVVVTDDSPQEMWAVAGADVIFVPSNTTREKILGLLLPLDGIVPEVVTVPYPVSQELAENLSENEYRERLKQSKGKDVRLMIPVSGAAVQLNYFKELIKVVTADGMKVTVVSRDSSFTAGFLNWCMGQAGVEVISSTKDQDVVEMYQREYEYEVFGAEVTKPSEQAFKALMTPRQRGGSVMLFSPPVGRQEKDNIAFMRRHRLIPSVDDQARINEWGLRGNRLHITKTLLERARFWRGIMLPENGTEAGIFIMRLIEAGVIASMVRFGGFIEGHNEIRSDGVEEIWRYLKSYL